MKILWLFICGFLKIGVLAGLFLAALVLAIWGLERSGVLVFRAGIEQDRSISLAQDSGTATPAASNEDNATNPPSFGDDSTCRAIQEAKALERLTEQARAAQAEAEDEYKRLRSRVNAIINARPSPQQPTDTPQCAEPEDVSSSRDDGDQAAAAPEDAPGYGGLKDRLENLSSGRSTGSQDTPGAAPLAKPITPVDAPQYQDLKQRLADILGTEQ